MKQKQVYIAAIVILVLIVGYMVLKGQGKHGGGKHAGSTAQNIPNASR